MKMPGDKRKADYLVQNTDKGIDIDEYVYRIFNVDHLIKDLRNEQMTLVLPCETTQKDELENHLRESTFEIDDRTYKAFETIMSKYYAQSWSRKPVGEWDAFGGAENNIRIKCRASALIDRLMNTADRYYSLSYYLWQISYEDADEIKSRMHGGNYEDYIDSTGVRLLKTVMTLNSDFAEEEEIRLLYIRRPQEDNIFPNINTLSGGDGQFCTHVFDWRGLIEEYSFNPHESKNNPDIAKILLEYNPTCQENPAIQ